MNINPNEDLDKLDKIKAKARQRAIDEALTVLPIHGQPDHYIVKRYDPKDHTIHEYKTHKVGSYFACSCPLGQNREGGICKHTEATAMYVEDERNN